MPPRKATLGSLLNDTTARLSRNLGVSCPGVVTSFNASDNTVNVQPAVHRLVPSEEDPDVLLAEEMAVEFNVPVMWPAGRGFQLANVTLQAGDPVLLVVCDRDISPWRTSGKVGAPDDAREHDYSSCVAIPGLQKDGGSFPTPSDAAALASKLDAIGRLLAPPVVAATNPAQTMALVNVILAAFQTVYTTALSTSASNVLRVGS